MWEDLVKPLVGRIVALEPLDPRHVDDLFEASRDPEVWRWLPLPQPDSREQVASIVDIAMADAAAGREGAFATVHRATGRAIGSTRYLALRPEHRGLEVGWTWLASSAWRTGANVEAKRLMLGHAFDELDCLRVEFKTDARNERSRAALEALPARFEGVFRRHMLVPDGVRDSAYYSVIAEEWPAVRANLERRLAERS